MLKYINNEFLNIQSVYQKSLIRLTERFQTKFFKSQYNESVLQYFQLITNSLLWISSVQRRLSEELKVKVVDPFETKLKQYLATNDATTDRMSKVTQSFKQSIKNLTSERGKLLKYQESYYKKCENNDKVRREYESYSETDLQSSSATIGNIKKKWHEANLSKQDAQTTYYVQLVLFTYKRLGQDKKVLDCTK